jgi:hypothetical protein
MLNVEMKYEDIYVLILKMKFMCLYEDEIYVLNMCFWCNL